MKWGGVLILSFVINFLVCDAIWLYLPGSGTKCVSEEIQNNVVVLGDYVVVSDDHNQIPNIAIKVLFLLHPHIFWLSVKPFSKLISIDFICIFCV